jgi:F-type H+-transporting ATPase subunit alpha
MAYDIAPDYTGVILLSGADTVQVGQGATCSGTLPVLPIGPDILGRLIDPLGLPLDDLPAPGGAPRLALCDAPELTARASVDRSLHTGIMAIDAAIPIGRGQRQLILGDRNVGKTALALDIVAAQKESGVICVYVAIGQPMSRVLAIRDALRTSGALPHTVVVAAEAAETPAMQYLAPYSGTSVAEYFREQGRDTLIIYDDLTKHADAYRELALLLGRPPGREAFPGDIFYIHGELLERASAFSSDVGGGSITAFPIVETTDNDISSYIPTNLISITDGQIYLDTARFERNLRPAIDIGKSVSRIGGVAQLEVLRKASKNLRIQVARFESLEAITRVGLDVDPKTQSTLERGQLMRELLRQPRFTVRTVVDQVLALTAVSEGLLDGLEPSRAGPLVWRTANSAKTDLPELVESITGGAPLDDESRAALKEAITRARAELGDTTT